MNLRIRYFASIREAVGQGSEELQVRGETLGALRDELIARGGWQGVPSGQSLKLGSKGNAVVALRRRLMELGFVPGEKVQILRRMLAGRGPLAVRVGTSTFAMRQLESSMIEVVPA